jgi:predicted Fe-Mo cluster-binding NifX family protein
MRYAVPVTSGEVSAHFGHCEQFALIDIDENSKKVVKKEMVTPPPHEPGLLPAWLAEKGANFVIAGGMGSRAQTLFQQNKIGVITGSMETDPEKAVVNYVNGNLETGDNSCDH